MEPAHLPESLLEIVDLIGLQAATALVKWRGGTYAYIPSRLREDDSRELVAVVGLPAAQQLSRQYGNSRIYIPRAHRLLLARRNQAIVQAYDAGTPASALCLRYGLTERQIWRILQSAPADSSQLALFRSTSPPRQS